MSNEHELVQSTGVLAHRQATEAASLCKSIVVKTACMIQNRKYVKVEGWQAIAVAHGCILSARDVEKTDTGFRAIGEVRRMSDGQVLATAEGFVGDAEKTWGNREEYAKRAMAQTRAMSRAARSAFAHVVVMMDAGLETTPAEEVPHDGFDDRRATPPPMKRGSDLKPPPRRREEVVDVQAEREELAEAIDNQLDGDTDDVINVEITDVLEKEGTSGKKKWLRFDIITPKGKFSTFDIQVGKYAKEMIGGGLVKIQYETSGDGRFKNCLGILS